MHTLSAIALVAEEKIREAQREGAFDNLPGAGKPLCLDDEANVPPEMRMAYKILKNSGYLSESNGAESKVLKIRTENQEEAAARSSLTRFAVMYSRLKKSRQQADTGGAGAQKNRDSGVKTADAQGLDTLFDVTVSKALEDSPYFEKILKKF
jgi:hypothetical protein